MIQDCKSAIRFFRSAETAAKYGVDGQRIVVWGESAGGHAAAFLGCTSDPSAAAGQRKRAGKQAEAGAGVGESEYEYDYDVGDFLDVSSSVLGVVDYYGPTDFLSMDDHLPGGYQTHGDVDSPESLYLGGQISTIPGLVREADPCSHVEAMVQRYRSTGVVKQPAFFVAHGTADRIVPEYMSEVLVGELERWGVEVEYFGVEGADHVFRGIREGQQRELDGRTDGFLGRVVGGKD